MFLKVNSRAPVEDLIRGLVIDGGMAINKRMRIADDAEQAARVVDDLDERGLAQHQLEQPLGVAHPEPELQIAVANVEATNGIIQVMGDVLVPAS